MDKSSDTPLYYCTEQCGLYEAVRSICRDHEKGIRTAEKFQRIYDSWFCSGEIQEKYRIKDSVTGREQKLPLYHKGVDGMCRMLEEGIIDEKEFFEIFWETPYETLKENEKYTGFYPSLPGCIASAEGKNQLKEEMRTALKKWIRSAFYMWRENNILEE